MKPSMFADVVVAIDPTGLIGDGPNIPWRYPEDFKRFKEKTMGDVLIMGRTTVRFLPRKLEGRTVIGVSDVGFDGMDKADVCVRDLKHAFEIGAAFAQMTENNLWIAGGASIYRQCFELGIVGNAEITIVPEVDRSKVSNPVLFPIEKLKDFELIKEITYPSGLIDRFYKRRA